MPLEIIGGIFNHFLEGRRRREEARALERKRAAAERAARLEHAKRMEILRKQVAMRREMMRGIVPLGIAALVVIVLIAVKRKK